MEAYCWSWGEGEEATSRLLAVSTKRGALLLPLPCCCYGRVPVLAGGRRACRCRVAALLRGARLEQRKSSSWGPPSVQVKAPATAATAATCKRKNTTSGTLDLGPLPGLQPPHHTFRPNSGEMHVPVTKMPQRQGRGSRGRAALCVRFANQTPSA